MAKVASFLLCHSSGGRKGKRLRHLMGDDLTVIGFVHSQDDRSTMLVKFITEGASSGSWRISDKNLKLVLIEVQILKK